MKILHTSDWHLGHTLYNYDRTPEQEDMLSQMVDIVRTHLPDVFLLCGDVYHTAQPSAAVQTMFTQALVRIHEANPDMVIVVTAGNHDSPTRHDIFHTPWKALHVHTIGSLYRDSPADHIICIPNKGYVVAIPYAHERNIPDGFFQQVLDLAKSENSQHLPIVLSAHTTISGCDYQGHDHTTEQTIGGIDTLPVEQLGTGYDYLALGHIHREQFIHTGRHNVRYSGTPLPITFDETYSHSVSLVEIDAEGSTPRVEKIEIRNPHPLVTLPVKGYTTWDEAKKLLQDFPNDIPAYIRLNVEVDGFLPVEANDEAIQITQDKQCRFCIINAQRHPGRAIEQRALSVQEFQQKNPMDIAKQYAEDSGLSFSEEMQALFEEAAAQVEEDNR